MQQRNIIFCHVDQLSVNAISGYGCKDVNTPNMDRLIREGTSFRLSASADPVCCPARASWYTGRMAREHGLLTNSFILRRDIDLPDLGQWLSRRDYRCFFAGKWHVSGRSVSEGFEVLYRGSAHGELYDADTARTAEGFLQNYSGEKPFFLNVGLLNPHDCCYMNVNPYETAVKMGMRNMPEPMPVLPLSYDASKGFGGGKKHHEVNNWGPEEVRMYRYYYFRQVEMVDLEVGRVYDALRRSGHADNTLFIFSSDHGEQNGAHNQFHKFRPWDESMMVPLVVCGPGIPPGRIDEEHPVSAVDITATILDYAGAPMMPDMTYARSLRPLLEDAPVEWREAVVSECPAREEFVMIREKKFKAIFSRRDQTEWLFDMEADPNELNDLSGQPDQTGTLSRFRRHKDNYFNTIKPCPKEHLLTKAMMKKRKKK